MVQHVNNCPQRRALTGARPLTVLALVLLFILSCLQSEPVAAAAAQTVSIKVSQDIPVERPSFRLPNDPGQLFFLQRSANANTIVYSARIGADGKLDRQSPVDVYWRRFAGRGERKELGTLERYLAFGVNTYPGQKAGEYLVEFKALPGRKMTLRTTEDGKFELTGSIGKHKVRPLYIFVDLDQTSLVPRVEYLYLHGLDLTTGMHVTETLAVSGGAPSN